MRADVAQTENLFASHTSIWFWLGMVFGKSSYYEPKKIRKAIQWPFSLLSIAMGRADNALAGTFRQFTGKAVASASNGLD